MAVSVDSEGAAAILASLLPLRLVRPIVVAAPVAGADISIKVPGGVIWEILSLRATFTASAVVANRRPTLQITDADGLAYQTYRTRVDVAAAGVANYNWIAALGYEDTVEPAQYGLPSLPSPLPQSFIISTLTSAIDVGDQWSAIRLLIREWAPDRIADTVNWIENDVLGIAFQGGDDSRNDY